MHKEIKPAPFGRILVVDDTAANLQLLTNLLTEHGYTVHPASDGELALEFVRSIIPDLILLDIRMPGMDGYEVCRRLKADERTRSVPIIFISILEDERDKVKGFQEGAVDYITKPVQAEEVLARVRTHLRLRELTEHLEQEVTARTAELMIAKERLQQELAERKNAEKALRASEEKYRRIVDTATEGILALGPDDRITFVNARMAEMLDYPGEEMMGRLFTDFMFEEDSPDYLQKMETRRKGISENYERRLCRKDGEEVWTYVSATPVLEDEHHFKGSFGMFTDITERKQAEKERERLQEQFLQAQKMELVGRLAGGVAHDFNNMLSVIMGFAELALDRAAHDDSLRDNLEEILAAASRSANITRQLLAFARKQTISPVVLDLNQTVESMLKMLRRLIGEDINLTWMPGPELWPIKMDPVQLDQILANLCVNARDAIADVGQVAIRTQNVACDEEYCADHADALPGEYVQLAVSDDGCGMDRETRHRLFEPFFTTKGVGKGTGLGLATVYGIVRQNSGFVNVYSEPGHGTIFSIYLPRHAAGPEQGRRESSLVPSARGQETILLVEDDAAVLGLVMMTLESLGYRVLAAATPGEAVRIAKERSGEINLLLTDVIMPEMTGRDLAQDLTLLYPTLKKLFMSGYTSNIIAHHGVLDDGVNFIQKPFSRQVLATKVREVLDRE